MIKSIIVDDEPKARVNLNNLLNDYCPSVEVVGMAGSVNEAVALIDQHQPQLVFLDVEMQGETGFDLLKRFDSPSFKVIFVTAYSDFAIQAFKYNAIDYLLKPIDIDELELAVKKIEEDASVLDTRQVSQLVDQASDPVAMVDKLVLPTLESLLFVEIENILRLESSDNYTFFHFVDGGRVLVSKNIKYYEDLLSKHGFCRVHRSHVVNLKYVNEYYKGDSGYIVMSDNSNVPVSRRKKADFLGRFVQV